ncbi:rab-GTPase-TBC domain-containing protein [Radiomyces spectabilis]|uniref:rab-GTPase-TBC domain-containing protein n=1 Tax=Radiomyces spectabilis TaxID=64574 RepID=UPI00221F180D|nr:rab-GTPase-TBC domain-containing protein [Radiomyces spectabilis]KAI8371773.1 rab-GTPase-TBC domain-containing protein [Radiomyces spectabilis]
MDVRTTRHTSTDLDEIKRKIDHILKDPAEAFAQTTIDIDAMTLSEAKAFAEQAKHIGGLGACVSKADVLAETSEDLMYLSGERIVVLKHIKDDTYLGYCEGVIGRFNAETVHFVELDPRVLKSLDADLELTLDSLYHNSDNNDTHQNHSHHPSAASDSEPLPRQSLQSVSSTSFSNAGDRPYPAKASLESFATHSSGSAADRHHPRQGPYHPPPPPVIQTAALYPREPSEHFDTSDFNDSYSNDFDLEEPASAQPQGIFVAQQTQSPSVMSPGKSPFPVTTTLKKSVRPKIPLRNRVQDDSSEEDPMQEDADHDGDDEDDETGNDSGISSRGTKSSALNGSTETATVDEYGFIIDPKKSSTNMSFRSHRSDMSAKSIKAYREREVKWLSIVGKLDAGTAKKDAKLKKLVRTGIPASVRARVWQFLAGSAEYRKSGMFKELAQRPKTKIYEVIERDIARCYPDHTQFKDPNGQGQTDLRSILQAYSQYNSQLEYCQGMGRLAGCMLMQMPVEDAFWLLVSTIDRYMNGYFTPSLSQLRIDAYIIGQLLKDHHPKLAQHLETNDVLPIMYIAQWFLTAFTMTLPWNSVLRVWDVFYFEGVKVFYRISLAILELCKDHLLQSCPTNSELLAFLLHIPHEYLGPDALLDTAFRIKLSKVDIQRYAKKASTSNDAATMGLPFEHGIKNLKVGNTTNFSSPSLPSLKGLSGKIKRRNSSGHVKDSYSSYTLHES